MAATLSISILADAAKARKAISDTSADLEGLGKSSEKASSGIGGSFKKIGETAAGFLGANAVQSVVGFGSELISLGGTIQAQGAKAGVIFGDSLGSVQAWAEGSAKSMGVTRTEAINLAASQADLLKPMGFTTEAAAAMSQQMVGLSGTLSKWSGGQKSAAEVSDIITKAMLGETDGLKGLGISISAADVQARLAANGQDKLTGAALEQAKAMAVQQLIMAKSEDAQKAVASGAFAAGDAQLALTSKFGEVKEMLASKLFPVFTSFMGFIATTAVPALESLGNFVGITVVPALQSFAGIIADNTPFLKVFGAALGLIGVVVLATLVPSFIAWAASALAAAAANALLFAPIVLAVAVLAALAAGVVYAYQNFEFFRTAVDKVAEGFSWLWNNVVTPFIAWLAANFIPIIKSVIESVVVGFQTAWGVVGPIVGFIVDVIGKWIGIQIEIGKKVAEAVIWIVGKFGELWSAVQPIVSKLIEIVSSWATSIGETATKIFDVLNGVVSFFGGVKDRIGAVAGGMFDGIKNAFKSAINLVINGWNALQFSIPGFDLGPAHFDGFHLGVPHIPALASGGIITRPTVALVGEAGPEAVIPLSRLNHGNTYKINVNVTSTGLGSDSPQIARDVVAALRNYTRLNGAIA